jgi:hypothetical protein
VEARWRAAGAQTLATADSGAISFRLSAAGELTGPILARLERRRRWTDVTDRLRQSAFLAAPHLQ